MTRSTRMYLIILTLLAATGIGCGQGALDAESFDHFGQIPPGRIPQLYAPHLVSSGLSEESTPTVSPNGRVVLWAVHDGPQHVILQLERQGDSWVGPEVAPFSGRFSDGDPVFSGDGRTLYFRSRRPLAPGGAVCPGFRTWVVPREADGWGSPLHVPELDPYVISSRDAAGTLYAASESAEGEGGWDLFSISPEGDIRTLGSPINGPGHERFPSVTPEGDVLLFEGRGGPYVSFRGGDGAWCEPRFIGDRYPAAQRDRRFAFSHTGREILFVGWRFRKDVYREEPLTYGEILERLEGPQNLRYDVYWMASSIIDEVRPERDLHLEGDLLGQTPPGLAPELFAPAIVSTGIHEHSAANFSPDGDELFYVASGPVGHTLLRMWREDGLWRGPEVAPFSGHYRDDCPSFTRNGTRLYFTSRRPRHGGRDPEERWGIWYVDRTDRGWGEPVLEEALTELRALTPSYARSGNVYFALGWDPATGAESNVDIFMVEPLPGGGYSEPRSLGPNVNGPGFEAWHFIHPDETYLIFTSYGRRTGEGLYVSFRETSGEWGPARWMGQAINQGLQTRMARLSPDGRYLFFNRLGSRFPDTSEQPLTHADLMERAVGPQNGPGDIFWVDARILDEIRGIEEPDLKGAVKAAALSQGKEMAARRYRELTARHPDYYDRGSDVLNDLGYELMGEGETGAAIAIFELNAEVHANEANPHDSLAEAYLEAGDRARARESYERALALDPTKASAIRALRHMKEESGL